MYIHYIRYEWDEEKAAANLKKHGIAFALAEDFDWENAEIIPDGRREYGEQRFLAYGMIGKRLHVMVYTPRKGAIRIVGLRRANERERRQYEENKETEET